MIWHFVPSKRLSLNSSLQSNPSFDASCNGRIVFLTIILLQPRMFNVHLLLMSAVSALYNVSSCHSKTIRIAPIPSFALTCRLSSTYPLGELAVSTALPKHPRNVKICRRSVQQVSIKHISSRVVQKISLQFVPSIN